MNLQNYQLVKEENWYYLAKKHLAFCRYVNMVNGLDDYGHWKGQTPSSSKVCSPASLSKSELSDQQEGKSGKNLSPLVLNTKEKMFYIAADSTGRSSPLTVKSDIQSPAEPRRPSKDYVMSQEKRLSADGISPEGSSLIRKPPNRKLILRIKGSSESISSGERRRSNDTSDEISTARDVLNSGKDSKETKLVLELKDKDKEGQNDISDAGDSSVLACSSGDTTIIPSNPESFDSPSSTVDSVSFSMSATGSQMTSAVQSPVVSDVSIQLTKIDGRCEPFRSSPERSVQGQDMMADVYNDEDQNEAVLKRCSSFAGFRSEESCKNIKDEENFVSTEVSPEKGCLQTLGSQGRFRHCSAPLSGQVTPKSRVSALTYTPSCISSRGSFTEEGRYYSYY